VASDEEYAEEAWAIASRLVADFLDNREEPCHRVDGTSESYLHAANREALLHQLGPGSSTWSELLGLRTLVVQGQVFKLSLYDELAKTAVLIMRWMWDLREQGYGSVGETEEK